MELVQSRGTSSAAQPAISQASNAPQRQEYTCLHASIQRLLAELSSADELGVAQLRPSGRASPHLPVPQEISMPPDGLCLSHSCVAAFDANAWRETHRNDGFRSDGNRVVEQLEVAMAKLWRNAVTATMNRYAVAAREYSGDANAATLSSDAHPARGRTLQGEPDYAMRAEALANGELPELTDIPFYAYCLGGCIEVLPLGYAAHQQGMCIGEGSLCMLVGNLEVGTDARTTGHYILLQSWMPVVPELQARLPRGGVAKATRQLEDMLGQDASNKSHSASSASEPAVSLTALSNLLADVAPSEQKAKVLEHAAKVLAWKKDRTHANRDTMKACCVYWQIAQKVQQQNRKPEVLAAELEARALSTTKVLLASKQCTADAEIGSAEQPASTSAE